MDDGSLDNLDLLTSFLQVSNWLTGALELDELLTALVKSAVSLVKHAEAASLFLVDETTQQLVVRAVHNYGDEILGLRFSFDEGIAGWVVRNRQAAMVEDFPNDARIL